MRAGEESRSDIHRRWWIELAITVGLLAASGIIALLDGGSVPWTVVALMLFGIGGVAGVSFVFYEVGRGEDRAREQEAAARLGDDTPPPQHRTGSRR